MLSRISNKHLQRCSATWLSASSQTRFNAVIDSRRVQQSMQVQLRQPVMQFGIGSMRFFSSKDPTDETKGEEAQGIGGEMDAAEENIFRNFDVLKVDDAKSRSDMVKNLSLSLLSVGSPSEVLDIFTREIIQQARSPHEQYSAVTHENEEEKREVFVEELLMILHFFKAQLRDEHDQVAKRLIEQDYRVKQLVAMIFDRYGTKGQPIDFTYQVSAIHSLAVLHKFYDLELTEDHKDTLIKVLDGSTPEDGSIMPEVPSLIFLLHLLETPYNRDQVLSSIGRLSAMYLDLIGERVDLLSCSNMLSGWNEMGFRNDELFEHLAELICQQAQSDVSLGEGQATTCVNIVKAVQEMGLEHDEFIAVILEQLLEHFEKLPMNWACTLFKIIGSMQTCDQELLLATMAQMSQPMHKKLRLTYDSHSMQGRKVDLEEVPDFTDYQTMWLSLQLFAAKRTRVQLNPSEDSIGSGLIEESAAMIKLLANDLVKVFYGNRRWQPTQMNIEEAAIVASGVSLVRIENQKFIADIGDLIRHNLKEANGPTLVLLVKAGHYMRNFQHTRDIYSAVHARAMSKFTMRELEPDVVKVLETLFSQHQIITDSPFVKPRTQR